MKTFNVTVQIQVEVIESDESTTSTVAEEVQTLLVNVLNNEQGWIPEHTVEVTKSEEVVEE